MQEKQVTINGFETTVLEGDEPDERTESESRVGDETTTVMGGLDDPRSNLNELKGDESSDDSKSVQPAAEKQAEPVSTKARKSVDDKSA